MENLIGQKRTLDDIHNTSNSSSIDKSLTKEDIFTSRKKLKTNEQDMNSSNELNWTKQNEKSLFYINKLKDFPEDTCLEYMVSFREMMFEDLLQDQSSKRTLESAFMTTYGFSDELLEPIVKAGCHLVISNDRSKDSNVQVIKKNYKGYANFIVLHPNKPYSIQQLGAYHPKLWLLKFPNFLRVVISSGNLTLGDWTVWSNCLWYQDFKKKEKNYKEQQNKEKGNFDYDQEFKRELENFMFKILPDKTNYRELLKMNLDEYIYENIDVILIPSIPGRHQGENMRKYGHLKIKEVLEKIQRNSVIEQQYKITYQTSSVGNIDENFISTFCSSFYKTDKIPQIFRYKQDSGVNEIKKMQQSALNNFRMIYPTRDYIVNQSYHGIRYAGCLLLRSSAYDKATFPKQILYKFEGNPNYAFSHGIIPHLKVIIATRDNDIIDDNTIIYFGSHNLSSGAWGKFEKKDTQFTIFNTELGVLLPPKLNSATVKQNIINSLPFKFPPEQYNKNDVPFIIDENYDDE